MSNLQFGKNVAGVDGLTGDDAATTNVLIDLPGVGVGVKYHGNAIRWNVRTEGKERQRVGRGTNRVAKYRYLWSGGGGSIRVLRIGAGTENPTGSPDQMNDWPAPEEVVGAAGTVIYTIRSGKTITVPILVTGYDSGFDTTKKEDEPGATLEYVTTGLPVFTGWTGVQPKITALEKTDLQTYDGTVFTYDQQGLGSGAVVTIDCWGADVGTDIALLQRLQQKLSTVAPPMPGLKLRPSDIAQDAIDGGTITLIWGLTDTKDDIENQSVTRKDPKGLFDTAELFRVQANATPAAPPAPVGKLIGQSIRKLNDGKWEAIYKYGSRDSKDDLEFLRSIIEDDLSDLNDRDVIVVQNNSQTPPGTVPPPRIAGLQHIATISVREGGSPEVWTHAHRFARNTAIQELEFAGTRTSVATGNVGDSAIITKITATASPEFPAAPIGVLTGYDVEQLTAANGAYTGYWRHIYRYGNTTPLQRIEFQGQWSVDLSSLNDVEEITKTSSSILSVPATPTPQNDSLQFVRRTSERVQGTPELWQWHFFFARNRAEDDITTSGTETRFDPDQIGQTARIRILNDSDTPPDAPDPPQDLEGDDIGVWIETIIQPLKVAHGSFDGIWVVDYLYGPLTRKQAIEKGGTVTRSDPVTLYESRKTTVVDLPTTPEALALSLRATEQLDKTFKSLEVVEFEPNVARVTKEYTGEDKIIRWGGAHSFLDNFRGKPVNGFHNPVSFNNTAALIHINVGGIIVGGPGGFLGGRVMSVYQERILGEFTYERHWLVADPASKTFADLEGKVCNATFLGQKPYTTKFVKGMYAYTYNQSGARTTVYRYLFKTDSEMFVNDGDLPDSGSRVESLAGVLAGSGFYFATIFDAFALLSWPESADFAVFSAAI